MINYEFDPLRNEIEKSEECVRRLTHLRKHSGHQHVMNVSIDDSLEFAIRRIEELQEQVNKLTKHDLSQDLIKSNYSNVRAAITVTADDIYKQTLERKKNEAAIAAMNEEIKRQIVEYDLTNQLNMDGLILWQLHSQLGFGKKRLKRFYDAFGPAFEKMVNNYKSNLGNSNDVSRKLLLGIGVDVKAWNDGKKKKGGK